MSLGFADIVFIRTWFPVKIPRFYNPICSLLTNVASHPRMLTVRELRQVNNLPTPVNRDSLYKPIERDPRVFNKLRIPHSLLAELPFKMRPKQVAGRKSKHPTLEQKRALIMEPEERKALRFLQEVSTLRNDKVKKVNFCALRFVALFPHSICVARGQEEGGQGTA